LNIARIFQATPMGTPTTLKCHSSPISHYFVKVHNLVALAINHEDDELVVN
jgi:hypothetical protein